MRVHIINKLNCFLVVKFKNEHFKLQDYFREQGNSKEGVGGNRCHRPGCWSSNVILINADKVVFTGKKETDKVYTRYTGYPGGQRFQTPAELRKRNGGVEKFLRHAVKGMLPKGPLGRSLLNNLYIYEGTEHPHEAQKPKAIDINQYK